MQRVTLPARERYREELDGIGLSWHTLDGGTYWSEEGAYAFTPGEIERLERAANELVQLCFDTVEDLVGRGDFDGMGIPEAYWAGIRRSWNADAPTLYGRMDLAYTLGGDIKLLEFNADTPTSLFEASVAQWLWLEGQQRAGHVSALADQWNRLHEALIEQFRHFREARALSVVHFTCARDTEEDFGTVQYLRDVAQQAGVSTDFLFIDEIGVSPENAAFIDRDKRPMQALFKLYPLEWMVGEAFGPRLLTTTTQVIEPLWKLLLSNKAILAKLWDRHAGHPLLLPASLKPGGVRGDTVRKPLFSREGANVTIQGRHATSTAGEYGAEGFVEQAYVELPEYRTPDGQPRYPVLGAWVVGQDAAGLGVREGRTRVTDNTASFCPHFIR